MTRPAPKSAFVKGDPRIRSTPRPKHFNAVRELARQLSHEFVVDLEGKLVVDGERFITITEHILKGWAYSPDPRVQQMFLEYAYGKPPVAVTVDETITIGTVDDWKRGLEKRRASVTEAVLIMEEDKDGDSIPS